MGPNQTDKLLHSKGNHKKITQPTEWEKIVSNNATIKGLSSKIYKQLIQCNRIENPEINPDTYGQLIFDKGGKNIKWETVFLASGAGKTGQMLVNQ